MADRFQVNEPTIAFEEIEGEVVLINFENGHYHALNTTGAELFAALTKGHALADVIAAAVKRFGVETAADDVTRFVAKLHHHGIVVPRHGGDEPAGPVLGDSPPEDYEPPVLETYDDMEHFLLLDPIQDVDEAGWPKPAAAAGTPRAER